MRRIAALSIMGFFISISFFNCNEDDVITPGDNHNPTVIISTPADEASFKEGETISFAGAGEDYKSNVLPDSMLVWTSDHDDTIGTGTSFASDALSVNTHVITFTGTDSDGNTDSDNITIYVTYDLIAVSATSGYPMGWGNFSPDGPVHTVSLDEFQIGKYEVTYKLWVKVRTWAYSNGYTFDGSGEQGYGGSTTDQHPVTMINWRDCIAWCNAYSEKGGLTPVYYTTSEKTTVYRNSKNGGDIGNDCVDWNANGFRLPTEAEWEYAARYIDGSSVSSGNKHSGYNLNPDVRDCAWCGSGYLTHPVGQLQANSLGAYDMSGNLPEWCWDWWDDYPSSPQDNPVGPNTGSARVLRGGGTLSDGCSTSSWRASIYPGSSWNNMGFGLRVCRGDSSH